MNIGPLLRSMMGDSRPGEPKSLELKTGQVVRGTVMSVSDDGQEAVIQVQGVKLHAALETPLRPGETTLLQVQPKTVDGLVVLKPMDSQVATMSTTTLAKALEALDMDNTASNRELLQLMQKSGMPLTKDNVSLLLQVSGQKPAGVPLSEWIQSAGIAFSRGLPITAESVAGLHQAVFGPPLHVLLASLEEQIGNLVRASGGEPGLGSNPAAAGLKGSEGSLLAKGQAASLVQIVGTGGSEGSTVVGSPTTGSAALAGQAPASQAPASQAAALQDRVSAGVLGTQGNLLAKDSSSALVAKLQTVLAELNASIPQEGTGEGTAASRGSSTPGVGMPGEAPAAASKAAAAAPAAQGEGPAGPSPGARPTPSAEPWVGRVLKLLGAEHEQQALRAAAPSAPAQAPEAPPVAGASPQGAAGGANAPAPGGAQPTGSGPMAAPGEAPAPLLREAAAEGGGTARTGAAADKPAGAPVETARAAANAVLPHGGAEEPAVAAGSVPGAAAHATSSSAVTDSGTAHETLKSLLLQVVAADDLPAPLQEAARQLVQQLTGQQLLLNTDRTTPFAQVTMFLPFIGPDGTQTASVHIESRRGRKGELDPANCRLWFDLQMKTLGEIMVDVQVADKKVLLKIYSEQEATGAFLESRQDEIGEALAKTGYRLLYMKSEPLIPTIDPETGSGETHFSQPLSYAPTPYKGVDYRV